MLKTVVLLNIFVETKIHFSGFFCNSFVTLTCHPSDETLNRGPDSLWSLKIPGCLSKRVEVWPRHPGQICPLASDHHGLLTIPIYWLASSLCLLSTSKLVCGVWWAFWRTMAAVASSRWMLHTGDGWGDIPWQCRTLWVLRKSRKALYKCNELLLLYM